MHTAPHCITTSPTAMAERIRLTITVTPEVHEVFSRMSESTGLSLGRTMGDWLGDTIEGAQFVAHKVDQARKAPKLLMREMQAFTRGLVTEVDDLAVKMRAGSSLPDAQRPAERAAAAPSPPSSNTGGKVPRGRSK